MRNLLKAQNIRLTSVRESDIKDIEEWFNDVEFMRHYDMVPALPKNRKDVEGVLDHYFNSGEGCIFAIRLLEDDKIIGIAGYDEILWFCGTATIFIGIGSPDYKGKGVGKEAIRLLLDFGFNELNFHRIQLNVLSYNVAAIRLYEGAGFVKEGTFREFISREGQRHDMYLYGLLRREYKIL